MRDQYMRQADGLLIVYDVTNRQSFDEAMNIYDWSARVKGKTNFAVVSASSHDVNEVTLPYVFQNIFQLAVMKPSANMGNQGTPFGVKCDVCFIVSTFVTTIGPALTIVHLAPPPPPSHAL